MKKTTLPLVLMMLLFAACNNATEKSAAAGSDSTSTVDAAKDWKFGSALWTFHTFNFPDALDKVDSAGLTFIEPNTFHKTGPELKDSLIL